jgi:hypothetical protein
MTNFSDDVDNVSGLPNIRMRLVFSEEKKPYLLDISSLLYDFELMHDYSLLISSEYPEYRFSQRFYYRNGRPIKQHHRLRAVKLIKESPLTVELIIAGVAVSSGALWTIIQIIDKITNWKLDRKKKRLEIEKLEMELEKIPIKKKKRKIDFEEEIFRRKEFGIERSIIRRLETNPMKLENIELSLDTTESDWERK